MKIEAIKGNLNSLISKRRGAESNLIWNINRMTTNKSPSVTDMLEYRFAFANARDEIIAIESEIHSLINEIEETIDKQERMKSQ